MRNPARNEIRVELGSTKYAENHLVLRVDGHPLDRLLDLLVPGLDLEGLIPSLAGCADEAEATIARARFLPHPSETTLAPLLLCPDDLDFSCTLVVVEAVGHADTIEWRRVGLDRTAWNADPELRLGQEVDWFDGVGPFHFDRDRYAQAAATFPG